MISIELGVEDLADTRFAVSPIAETVFSLWALRDPGRHALHLPWRRAVLDQITTLDIDLLLSLVGPTLALPDFVTPRPTAFAPTFDEELAVVRAASLERVRRDLRATYLPAPLPPVLAAAAARGVRPVHALQDRICDQLRDYWTIAIAPAWQQIRLVLEADMTYRARQLATGGARQLFADMHPNLTWQTGVLTVDQMIGHHHVAAAGRGLLLIPSVFAYKPVPPLSPDEPPSLAYPSRGIATLWAQPPEPDRSALTTLLGSPKASLLRLLAEPLTTSELARRLSVTPSAISQHLQLMLKTGLVNKSRDGRQVLYRRSALGDQLTLGS
jgi:hypothetical protein